MTATPTQRIEAAIVRLEELNRAYFVDHGWLCELVTTGIEPNPVQEPKPLTDDPLMVTLHATIDAQLDWLSDQSARMKAEVGTIGTPEVHYRHALALADAIISGGTS